MVKQPAMEASEFTMSHEDFPALPGPGPNAGPEGAVVAGAIGTGIPGLSDPVAVLAQQQVQQQQQQQQPGPGAIGTPLPSQGAPQDPQSAPTGADGQPLQQQPQRRQGIQTNPAGGETCHCFPSLTVCGRLSLFIIFRFGNKHPTVHGDGPVRNDRLADVHQGG